MHFFNQSEISAPIVTSGDAVEADRHGYKPDHRVEFRVGGDSEGLGVHFDFIDAGDDNYDCEIRLSEGNEDWASPRAQVEALHLCTERFYELGFDTKFGRLVGTPE